MSDNLIELSNVTVFYPNTEEPALRNIDLTIRDGEFVAIIGPLNSGKSTLIRTISGIIPHIIQGRVYGTVKVCGMDIREHHVSELIECIGVVLDDPKKQIINLTVEDDIAFGPLNLGLSLDEVIKRTRYAINVMKLKGLEKRHPKELSDGQQQRVVLAGVLALRPRIIALDEPIALLDPVGKYETLSILKELNRKYGITVIVTESGNDLDKILEAASRVIVMNSGRIILDGTPEQIIRSGVLERVGLDLPDSLKLLLKYVNDYKVLSSTTQNINNLIKYLLKQNAINKIVKEVSKCFVKKHPRSNKEVLIANNIWYEYPNGVKALKGISLRLYEGEIVGIIGPNGSGKTTLALVLTGILKPTNKDAVIKMLDKNILELDDHVRIKLINYVFQNPDNQLLSNKVSEELVLAYKLLDMTIDPLSKEYLDQVVKKFGLEKYLDQNIGLLSRDIKLFTAIASIITLKPRVIIIDEPTNGLDPQSTSKLMNIVLDLKSNGHSIVIISHNMDLILKYCDRVIVVNDGKIVMEGDPFTVFLRRNELLKIGIRPPKIIELLYELIEKRIIDRNVFYSGSLEGVM